MAVKRQPSLEELRHRDFVGGVQHDRQAALRLERAIGQAQARETRRVSGGSNSSRPARARSSDGSGAAQRSGIRERVLNRQPHVGDAELRDHRAVASARPSSARSTADGRRRRSRSPATPNSQCASITSRPLFISVAESMVILRPICQVGCCSASSAVTRCRARDARRPRNGPPDAVRISRRTSRGVAAVQALMDGVVLAVDRQDRRRRARRAASMTSRRPSPALPCWRARSSCRRRSPRAPLRAPSVPDEAHSTRSTSGCVATATRPSRPGAATSRRRRRRARARSSSSAAPVAIADDARPVPRDLLGAARRRCRRRRGRPPRSRSGCASTTASALVPIEPVEPRMAMRFITQCASRIARTARRRTPARRRAARRCDRGRRRGRESARELSFTPALRFSIDSNRSPAMPSATIVTPSSARSRDGHAAAATSAPATASSDGAERRARRSRLRPSSSG